MRYNIYIEADGDILVYSINVSNTSNASNESSAIAEAILRAKNEGYNNIKVTKCIKNEDEE